MVCVRRVRVCAFGYKETGTCPLRNTCSEDSNEQQDKFCLVISVCRWRWVSKVPGGIVNGLAIMPLALDIQGGIGNGMAIMHMLQDIMKAGRKFRGSPVSPGMFVQGCMYRVRKPYFVVGNI